MKRTLLKGNNNVSSTMHDVTDTLSDRGQEVLHEAQKIVDRTGTKVRWVAEDLADLVEVRARRAARYVRRNSATILTAAGLGALAAGAMFLSMRRK